MSDLLTTLKDITLPNKIGFELASGWYFLFLLIGLLVGLIYYGKKYYCPLKKIALKKLSEIALKHQAQPNQQKLAIDCQQLLKRYLKAKNKQSMDSTNTFLQSLTQIKTIPKDIETILSVNIYQKKMPPFDAEQFIDYCRIIIKKTNRIK